MPNYVKTIPSYVVCRKKDRNYLRFITGVPFWDNDEGNASMYRFYITAWYVAMFLIKDSVYIEKI
jgi:hypothetical protein